MKKDFTCNSYEYKGVTIYQITKKDYCAWDENGMMVHEMTLKNAKAAIDNLAD